MVGPTDAEVHAEYARELVGFATAAVGPSDRAGLERLTAGPTDSNIVVHNSLTLASDHHVYVIDGGSAPNGGGHVRVDVFDRATGAATRGGGTPIPDCPGPIEITQRLDAPLDAVPYTCLTDGTAGTINVFR